MTEKNELSQKETPKDKLSIGIGVLAFLIPIVGIVIYFSSRKSTPNKAKEVLYVTLAGFVFIVLFYKSLELLSELLLELL